MAQTLVPMDKDKLRLKPADICQIIKTAREAHLLEFSYGELSFKLGEVPQSPRVVLDNERRRKEDLHDLAIGEKIKIAEEMQLTDPVAYEELMAKSLTDERAIMPELTNS